MSNISNLSKFKIDLENLIETGGSLFHAIQYESIEGAPKEFEKMLGDGFEKFKKKLPLFKNDYQTWYSEAKALLKVLLPDRVSDFVRLYEKPKTRKEITFENYVVEDYLQGLTVTRGNGSVLIVGPNAAVPKFEQQYNILKAAERRFESSLFDIKQLVQADLFDTEIETAKELQKNKFFRAAGAVAGVVLEKHLHQVCDNHTITIVKKHPTISDFNDLLKQHNVIETSQWRFIQLLGDLRNLCDHGKGKEPTASDITDLVDGVNKILKTVF